MEISISTYNWEDFNQTKLFNRFWRWLLDLLKKIDTWVHKYFKIFKSYFSVFTANDYIQIILGIVVFGAFYEDVGKTPERYIKIFNSLCSWLVFFLDFFSLWVWVTLICFLIVFFIIKFLWVNWRRFYPIFNFIFPVLVSLLEKIKPYVVFVVGFILFVVGVLIIFVGLSMLASVLFSIIGV